MLDLPTLGRPTMTTCGIPISLYNSCRKAASSSRPGSFMADRAYRTNRNTGRCVSRTYVDTNVSKHASIGRSAAGKSPAGGGHPREESPRSVSRSLRRRMPWERKLPCRRPAVPRRQPTPVARPWPPWPGKWPLAPAAPSWPGREPKPFSAWETLTPGWSFAARPRGPTKTAWASRSWAGRVNSSTTSSPRG